MTTMVPMIRTMTTTTSTSSMGGGRRTRGCEATTRGFVGDDTTPTRITMLRMKATTTGRGSGVVARAKRGRKSTGGGGGGGGRAGGGGASTLDAAMYVDLDLDVVGLEGEAWKLDAVVDALKRGAVGIIPTDTKYAFVADLNNAEAVQKLYDIKDAGLNKPLSILCRGFADIDAYTTGFPNNPSPGQPLAFKLAKQCLPGPYTFILPASKELPKVCLMDKSTKDKARQCKSRKTVGVRVPACEVARAILNLLDAPLMCSTVPECDDDPAVIYDAYLPRGLDFMVDIGALRGDASTVVDLSSGDVRVLRRGGGEPDLWASTDDDDETVENDEDAAWGFA